jgi:hypothetical protein
MDRRRFLGWGVALLGTATGGCGRRVAPPPPEAKVRLTQLLRLYQAYIDKNGKGPPNERALQEFARKLSPQERDERLIGDDLENIFTSPRDQQKYAIRFNLKFNPGGPIRAVAWEAQGKDGLRFVALSVGQVEEYDEATLKEYQR